MTQKPLPQANDGEMFFYRESVDVDYSMEVQRQSGVTLCVNSYGGAVETFAQHIIKANTIDTLKFLNDESFELRDRFTMDALTLLRDVSDAYRALQSAWSLLPLVGPLPVMKMPGAAASAQHAHTCPGEGYSRNVIYRTRIEQILPAH